MDMGVVEIIPMPGDDLDRKVDELWGRVHTEHKVGIMMFNGTTIIIADLVRSREK
jgi:hypothetical protein